MVNYSDLLFRSAPIEPYMGFDATYYTIYPETPEVVIPSTFSSFSSSKLVY